MKYLVVSDIHGSNYYSVKIEEIYKKEKPDKIILLGDLYYRGSCNPLIEQYDPMKVHVILNKYSDIIMCVKGNCDTEFDEMISDFKFEDNILLTIGEKRFFFTHGHKYNRDNVPENVDVCVYGHLHTGFITEENGVIFVNAGSISLPKNGTRNSYLIINEEKIVLKDIEGNVIDYI